MPSEATRYRVAGKERESRDLVVLARSRDKWQSYGRRKGKSGYRGLGQPRVLAGTVITAFTGKICDAEAVAPN
jgi:hypothetical protein